MNGYWIIRLKIQLDETPVWRIVEVFANIDLEELHEIIQVVMGWENRHLYQFNIDGERIMPEEEGFESPVSKYNLQSKLKKILKNLVDYMIGVEAGLDSNARKNRGGHSMEDIVGVFVQDLCVKKGCSYLKEADAEKIKKTYGIEVPVDKSSRRYDYVIKTETELVLMEVNFYGGGGSKLKSTAGEYRNLYDVMENKFKFIWVTDGLGWKTTARPLRETFNHNDYLLSLSMLEKGVLERLI